MLKNPSTSFLLFLSFLFTFAACGKRMDHLNKGDKIASVFDHDLYYDEVPEDILSAASPSDSTALLNSFVDQWIRKMLLLHAAEERVPESLNIDRLVEDYKQSLLINSLEKQVISDELDTIISLKELEELYDEIKENFIQDIPIIRITYYKFPEKSPQIDRFYDWWKKDNFSRMNSYSQKYSEVALTDPDYWLPWSEVEDIIDPVVKKRYNLKQKKSIQKNIGEYEYFIKVLEYVDKNNLSPLGYIEEQLKNIIIQKRKTKVINEYLERTYLQELKNKNIVLHNKKVKGK